MRTGRGAGRYGFYRCSPAKEFIMGTEMGILSMSRVVTVPEGIRVRAKRALDAMLAVPRDAS
jgi:quinolinate synthase